MLLFLLFLVHCKSSQVRCINDNICIYIYIYIHYTYIVFRHVPSCSVMFCRVPSCSVIFRRVPSCSVMFRHVPSCHQTPRRLTWISRSSNPGRPGWKYIGNIYTYIYIYIIYIYIYVYTYTNEFDYGGVTHGLAVIPPYGLSAEFVKSWTSADNPYGGNSQPNA